MRLWYEILDSLEERMHTVLHHPELSSADRCLALNAMAREARQGAKSAPHVNAQEAFKLCAAAADSLAKKWRSYDPEIANYWSGVELTERRFEALRWDLDYWLANTDPDPEERLDQMRGHSDTCLEYARHCPFDDVREHLEALSGEIDAWCTHAEREL